MKIIIIGAGQVGFHIANRLAFENKDVVVVDQNAEALRKVSESLDVQIIPGSGSSPTTLEDAGIKEAEILLAVTDSDETNLMACLMADILSPSTKKLARIRKADYDPFHNVFREKAPHIDTIINPEIEVVGTIDRMMSLPGAVDVGEFANGRVKFVGVNLGADAPLAGIRLTELRRALPDVRPLIAAILRNENLIIPDGTDRLMPGDLVYFISEENNLMKTLKAFGKHSDPVKRAVIVGGGRIGLRLALLLEKKSIYTKIIEKNADRCNELAERLNKAIILHGDGSDKALLAQENIRDADVFIPLTSDEETNILSSLLAKSLGVRKTITRISKFSYLPLMSMIGIEHVVSPRLSAINTILQHIRRGKVLSAVSLKNEQAEVLEAVALETSEIVGKPLKNISFPKGSLIAAIIREEHITIPTGDSVIYPDDRIIIFARHEAILKIEKILTVKLEFF